MRTKAELEYAVTRALDALTALLPDCFIGLAVIGDVQNFVEGSDAPEVTIGLLRMNVEDGRPFAEEIRRMCDGILDPALPVVDLRDVEGNA